MIFFFEKNNFINASRKYDLKELCNKSNKYRCKRKYL